MLANSLPRRPCVSSSVSYQSYHMRCAVHVSVRACARYAQSSFSLPPRVIGHLMFGFWVLGFVIRVRASGFGDSLDT